MNSQTSRTFIFFLLILFLFVLCVRLYAYVLIRVPSGNKDIKLFGVATFYTIIIAILFSIAQLCDQSETFTLPLMPCACKGGEYLYQGDSERAKMCRKLYSTDEGKKAIQACECSGGQAGRPPNLFEYTPDSDDCWKNGRCAKK